MLTVDSEDLGTRSRLAKGHCDPDNKEIYFCLAECVGQSLCRPWIWTLAAPPTLYSFWRSSRLVSDGRRRIDDSARDSGRLCVFKPTPVLAQFASISGNQPCWARVDVYQILCVPCRVYGPSECTIRRYHFWSPWILLMRRLSPRLRTRVRLL